MVCLRFTLHFLSESKIHTTPDLFSDQEPSGTGGHIFWARTGGVRTENHCARCGGHPSHLSEDQIKSLYLSRPVALHFDFDFQPVEPILTSLVSSQTLRVELGHMHSKYPALAKIKHPGSGQNGL